MKTSEGKRLSRMLVFPVLVPKILQRTPALLLESGESKVTTGARIIGLFRPNGGIQYGSSLLIVKWVEATKRHYGSSFRLNSGNTDGRHRLLLLKEPRAQRQRPNQFCFWIRYPRRTEFTSGELKGGWPPRSTVAKMLWADSRLRAGSGTSRLLTK